MTFRVQRASWREDERSLRAVREAVFVREQYVPATLEWDGADEEALHVLALDDEANAIGTGRLLPSGRIGRMAVLAAWRGRGVGRALLGELLRAARERGHAEVLLSAQTSAVTFYRSAGFRAEGEVYIEAGIPHQRMRLMLGAQRP
ncbi:MAG: GNAT family N-acetyltransferase [Pseudomonadota bacterium]|nr:MAG: GNAT family N-acetyltransferase [Pseudomonadota bacterium]